jgi:hypothetical protein
MRYEIGNDEFMGAAEWRGPGNVAVEMTDPRQQMWFENYFKTEVAFMTGSVECGELAMERRDDSPESFTRAARELAAYSFKVRQGDARRRPAYSAARGSSEA